MENHSTDIRSSDFIAGYCAYFTFVIDDVVELDLQRLLE